MWEDRLGRWRGEENGVTFWRWSRGGSGAWDRGSGEGRRVKCMFQGGEEGT